MLKSVMTGSDSQFLMRRLLPLSLFLLGFGSSALSVPAAEPAHAILPAEVSINEGAGRGDLVMVPVRLENGEQCLFLVDTGSPVTELDRSLESQLGRLVRTDNAIYGDYRSRPARVFRAPRLYLGSTPLALGDIVITDDLRQMFAYTGRPIMGILGRDCLGNYCLQFDFAAKKLRFLDPADARTNDWGTAIPLSIPPWPGQPTVRGTLLGNTNAVSIIDTGDNEDGMLTTDLFRQAVEENHLAAPAPEKQGDSLHLMATFTNGVFGGQSYHDLKLTSPDHPLGNSLGLRFLARNLVTIDYPRMTLYLKRTSADALPVQPDYFGPSAMLGWWAAENPNPAEDSAASLAERILDPPNLRPAAPVGEPVLGIYKLPMTRIEVEVGAPPATLSLVELKPGDYHFEARSGLTRAPDGSVSFSFSWHFAGPQPVSPLPEKGVLVVLHDYTRQKVQMFPWAFLLAQAGYRVILVDLRGHGESTGQIISYGKYETRDLSQMLDTLNSNGIVKGKVGVLGAGFGGLVALHWAAHDSRVGAVVALAPVDRIDQAFTAIEQSMKDPASPALLQQAMELAAKKLDLNWSDWSGESAVRQLKQPVFFISGGDDSMSPPADITRLEKAAPAGSKQLQIAGVIHRVAIYSVSDLAEPVINWFQEHLETNAAPQP